MTNPGEDLDQLLHQQPRDAKVQYLLPSYSRYKQHIEQNGDHMLLDTTLRD